MGNCQATIETSNPTSVLVIQFPANGRVEKHYSPLSARQVMAAHPGHYVALLLTTTTAAAFNGADNKNNVVPVRVTRIKLLKPTDTLLLGHVYRLMTAQDIAKGLRMKSGSKMMMMSQQRSCSNKFKEKSTTSNSNSGLVHKNQQVKDEKHRYSSGRWQPSLVSISEAAGSS
ncbi:unnamed protein product [Cuscuta epithymum]|uniref:Uncharacterized protein n=1 Tax=Cuscuta epithymum TaxID=186058 RepID=A0AAV0FXN8_9ASTE|nr:unnamed protein product [Cuscuta epithymum]